MSTIERAPYAVAAEALADKCAADVLLVNAGMYRPLARNVIALTRRRKRRRNVVLILITEGGEASEAYWLASCLQNCYESFSLVVPSWCKSAGTLVAVGARELVMGDFGELGPLDVQLSKPDELLQRQSGLTATAALETLHEKSFAAFEHFLLSILNSGGAAISTRTATHIAVQLTTGLFGPIYEHVDPMHVGEAGRALTVAKQYGELLNRRYTNLRSGALERLLTGYAAHNFVIDRPQTDSLFNRVRVPSEEEEKLLESISSHTTEPFPYRAGVEPFVAYLSPEAPQPVQESVDETPAATGANVVRMQTDRRVADNPAGGEDAAGNPTHPEHDDTRVAEPNA